MPWISMSKRYRVRRRSGLLAADASVRRFGLKTKLGQALAQRFFCACADVVENDFSLGVEENQGRECGDVIAGQHAAVGCQQDRITQLRRLQELIDGFRILFGVDSDHGQTLAMKLL